MQPQDPMQPQQPNPVTPAGVPMQPVPIAPVPSAAGPDTSQMFNPVQPQQPTPNAGMPMQPQMPLMGMPQAPAGMPVAPQQFGQPVAAQPMMAFSSQKKSLFSGKLARTLIGIAVGLIFAGLGAFKLGGGSTPKYSKTETQTYQGYSFQVVNGWAKKDMISIDSSSVSYVDYIDKAKKDKLYAQQIITVEKNVVDKADLTVANKKILKDELNNTNGKFFESIKTSVAGSCTDVQNVVTKADDSSSVKDSFILGDFSFTCKTAGQTFTTYAIGRVVLNTDGNAITIVVFAPDYVYTKNTATFTKIVQSAVKS